MSAATRPRRRFRLASHDGDPEPDLGRPIRLWDRRIKSNDARWQPVTFHEVLAALGGTYDRTAARALEAMVAGATVSTTGAHFRFRSEGARKAEIG